MEIPPGLIDSAAILRTRAGTDFIRREFRTGKLVRIRRGFYVRTTEWIRARPSDRLAWTTAAVARSVKGAVRCGETAALAIGLPTLKTPGCVELATTLPGRSGTRRSVLLVLGEDSTAQQVRDKRSYPLRYCLKAAVEPVQHGEFRCTGLMQTAVDVMVSGRLSNALVVADGVARRLVRDGVLAADSGLLGVPGIAERIAAHPFAAARRRAELAATLASPWLNPWVSPTAVRPLSILASSNRCFSTSSATMPASSARATAGGQSKELWGSSTARRSTWTRRSAGLRPRNPH